MMSKPRLVRIALLFAATAGLLLVFVFVVRIGDPIPPIRRSASEEGERSYEVGIPTLQKVEAFVQGYGSRVELVETELAKLRIDLEEGRKQLQESLAEIAKGQRDDAGLIQSVLRDLKEPSGSRSKEANLSQTARVRKFEFTSAVQENRILLHIPAGSFGEITLLTGVFAPIKGEALPVHARLNAALVGPNRTRVPIANAFLVGRAEGDANGSRAIVQFHKLSLVKPKGESVEAAINADVADSDGILGLAGHYVWRAREILALAGLSAGLSGAADVLAAREVTAVAPPLGGSTSVLTGDPLTFAGYRGASKGLEQISEIVAQRLGEIAPAIYVPNGKEATVLFLEGVTLNGFEWNEVSHEEDASPYAGLDFDR